MSQRQNKFSSWRWSRSDAIAAIAAAAAIAVTFINYELWKESRAAAAAANEQAKFAKKMFEAGTRARIDPTGAKLIGPIMPGQPLKIEITYRNSGHEPALISSDTQNYVAMRFAKAVSGVAKDIPKFENKTCLPARSSQQGLVVYPQFSRDYTSLVKIPPEEIPHDVFDGRSILYITGCITYQTLGAVHRSGYCFYLKPELANGQLNWQFLFCGDGNFAD